MTRCGTPCWTAPEIIKGDNYSEKADVYRYVRVDGDFDSIHRRARMLMIDAMRSFGIVMWEVLTRKVPYADQTFMSVALEILDGKRPDVPSDCPPEFKQLMQRCWHKVPLTPTHYRTCFNLTWARGRSHACLVPSQHQDKRPSMEEVTTSLEAQIVGSHRRCGGDNV